MTSIDLQKASKNREPSTFLGVAETTIATPLPPPSMGVSNAEAVRLRTLRSEPVVLRLRHIGKSYPIAGSDDRVVALKDINLAEPDDDLADTDTLAGAVNPLSGNDDLPPPFGPVRRGEFVMIRGPSGGGKTTLLNIIGTIDACTEGIIELNGRAIDKSTKENVLADIRLKALGFVFQTFNLIATMTAAENVELPMTLLGKLSSKEMRLRSRQLLTLVGLRNRINHLPSELSGGEQQRVTIARSLANNPALLLLDEPTGDLDTANTIEIMDLLTRINRRTKTTCIMVTHNPDIECYADRILYVNDGRFGKEVYNSVPTCLSLEGYTKYLAEKEKQITGLTRINANAASDDEDDEAAASVGGSVVRLHRDSRGNSSIVESAHGGERADVRLQRATSDGSSEVASVILPSRDTTGFFSQRSAQTTSPQLEPSAAPVGVTATVPSAKPRWQSESPLSGGTAAVPSSAASAPPATQVVHREEKEADSR